MPFKSSTGANAGSARRSEPADSGGLRARVVSALVLAPVVLAAVVVGGAFFIILVILISLLAVREWARMVEPAHASPLDYLSVVAVGLAMVVTLWLGPAPGLLATATVAVAFLIGAAAARMDHPWLLALGIPYIAVAAIAFVWLRDSQTGGLSLFLYLLLVIWATDIAAYAAGKSIGGPKLAPRISPKKTWAGLFGGMTGAAVTGGAVALVSGAAKPALAAGVALLLAVVGQVGDLFESAIKRRYHIKDSGRLIPGHGGLLDRIDGLLAAAPALAALYLIGGSFMAWW